MPYLILFFLLAIALVAVIVIVTRAGILNRHSSEIQTFMEIMDKMADCIPEEKLKQLQTEICDRRNLIRYDKDDRSDYKTGKTKAYGRVLDLLNQKLAG